MININEVIDELDQYALLDNTEWGETARALTYLCQRRFLLSKKLRLTLEKEVRCWLKNVKDNATIVEQSVEITPRVIKTLHWNN